MYKRINVLEPCQKSSLTTLVPRFPLISSTSPKPTSASFLNAFTAPSLLPHERNFLAFKSGVSGNFLPGSRRQWAAAASTQLSSMLGSSI